VLKEPTRSRLIRLDKDDKLCTVFKEFYIIHAHWLMKSRL